MSAAGRALRKVRESGVGFTLLLAFRRLVPEALAGGNLINIFSEALHDRVLVASRSGQDARWANEADVHDLAKFGLSPDLVGARFRSGIRLVVVECDERIVGVNWYDPLDHDEFGWLRYVLAPGDIWAFDGQVLPAYRGRGVFGTMRNFAAESLRQEGYRRILSQVEALNRAAIRARDKTTATKLTRYCYARLFGFSLIMHRGGLRVGRWTAARPYELRFQ